MIRNRSLDVQQARGIQCIKCIYVNLICKLKCIKVNFFFLLLELTLKCAKFNHTYQGRTQEEGVNEV